MQRDFPTVWLRPYTHWGCGANIRSPNPSKSTHATGYIYLCLPFLLAQDKTNLFQIVCLSLLLPLPQNIMWILSETHKHSSTVQHVHVEKHLATVTCFLLLCNQRGQGRWSGSCNFDLPSFFIFDFFDEYTSSLRRETRRISRMNAGTKQIQINFPIIMIIWNYLTISIYTISIYRCIVWDRMKAYKDSLWNYWTISELPKVLTFVFLKRKKAMKTFSIIFICHKFMNH